MGVLLSAGLQPRKRVRFPATREHPDLGMRKVLRDFRDDLQEGVVRDRTEGGWVLEILIGNRWIKVPKDLSWVDRRHSRFAGNVMPRLESSHSRPEARDTRHGGISALPLAGRRAE